MKDSDGTVLLPILASCLSQLDLQSFRTTVASDDDFEVVWSKVIKAERIIINSKLY